RLNVFAIPPPPLRDRKDDVLPLSEAFLAEYGRSLGRPPAGISRDARTLLMEYHWPGNVRELRNILERAAILCDGGLITAEHLAIDVVAARSTEREAPIEREAVMERAASAPEALRRASPELAETSSERRREASTERHVTVPARSADRNVPIGDLSSMERAMIEQALATVRFNKSKAAAALGLTRAQLYVRM